MWVPIRLLLEQKEAAENYVESKDDTLQSIKNGIRVPSHSWPKLYLLTIGNLPTVL